MASYERVTRADRLKRYGGDATGKRKLLQE
jgi:hypothetical protein